VLLPLWVGQTHKISKAALISLYTCVGDNAGVNRLSAPGGPHEMIEDQIDPMFISWGAVVFHADKYITIYTPCPLIFC
jgi:hypothetical protein